MFPVTAYNSPFGPLPNPVTCVGDASSSSVLSDVGIQAIDLAAVAGAEQRLPVRIEPDGVHNVLRVRPRLPRRTIGIDPVHFRSAGDGGRAASEGRRRIRALRNGDYVTVRKLQRQQSQA